jgi:hypothetical protein
MIAGERETMKKLTTLAALLVASLLAGCSEKQRSADCNSYPPVPALITETMPLPPVAAEPLMWQPGHWDWSDSGFVWANGQYVPAEGHGNLWMPGWWSRGETGCAWQPPHWTS